MAREIERKFLVKDDGWRAQVVKSAHYRQAYFTEGGTCSIRVRVEEQGRAAVVLGYEARRESDGEVCATGHTRLACVGRDGRLRRGQLGRQPAEAVQ